MNGYLFIIDIVIVIVIVVVIVIAIFCLLLLSGHTLTNQTLRMDL